MNTCAWCGIGFNTFIDYHEHQALNHKAEPLEHEDRELVTHRSGRLDLAKQAYKGPMDKILKAKIVAAGEKRLGKGAFYG